MKMVQTGQCWNKLDNFDKMLILYLTCTYNVV